MTKKMAGRAVEHDIRAVVDLLKLLEASGGSACENPGFNAAFEAAHRSMTNLTFELVNARNKEDYRAEKRSLASKSVSGIAPLEERKKLYRQRKSQRASLFAALNKPDCTGSSEHMGTLLEELGVNAIIAEKKGSVVERFVVRAHRGSSLGELTLGHMKRFNTFRLSQAIQHKPVITMGPPDWGLHVPAAPEKARIHPFVKPKNIASAAATSFLPKSEPIQVQSVQASHSESRNTNRAQRDSRRSPIESPISQVSRPAASNRAKASHSAAISRPAAKEDIQDFYQYTPPQSISEKIASQTPFVETPINPSGFTMQGRPPARSLVETNTYLSFNRNKFGNGKSLLCYGNSQVNLERFFDNITASDESSHIVLNISGENNDCWLRAAWLSIFSQTDPTVFSEALRDCLASRLRIRASMTEDELIAEANVDETSLLRRISVAEGNRDRFARTFDEQKRKTACDQINNLELEQRAGQQLRWGAGLRQLDKDIETVINIANDLADRKMRGAVMRSGNGGRLVFKNEEALKNVTYWILKQQSQYLPDSVLTSSVLGSSMGDADQIAVLHQAFSATSIVYSTDGLLHISPQPNSGLMPGSVDLGTSANARADQLARGAAKYPVSLHRRLHFNVALPKAFFQA